MEGGEGFEGVGGVVLFGGLDEGEQDVVGGGAGEQVGAYLLG